MELPPARLWLIVFAAAALCVGSLAGLLALQKERAGRGSQSPALAVVGAAPEQLCPVPQTLEVRTLGKEETAQVLLWAPAAVRLFVDGAPTFGSTEEPLSLPAGEHTFKALLEGQQLETRFRLEAFAPALFQLELDAEAGLTLVRLGSVCTRCAASLGPLDLGSVGTEGAAVLIDAARALRLDDWQTAAAQLRRASATVRRSRLFHRLAAAVYAAAAEPKKARTELAVLALSDLTDRLDALAQSEREREQQVVVTRWNQLTEAFARVAHRFEQELPAPVTRASTRLAELSRGFDEATQARDLERERSMQLSGEQALVSLVQQLRATRPADCPFQARVVSALAQ